MTSIGRVEHFFRHEYGRLVAMLARRMGAQYIEHIEDAVQSALMKAVETWPVAGEPDNPSAWLYRVAFNNVLAEQRQQSGRWRILEEGKQKDPERLAAVGVGESLQNSGADVFPVDEGEDDLLRMLFVCCDETLPVESQVVLALKTLCGFDVREIAVRLFTSEASIYKRLSRARSRLREHPPEFENLPHGSRLPAVRTILYLLFTEGYLSSHPDQAIRRELCDEAIRLSTLLAEHKVGREPETFALLALMHLHRARMAGRQNTSGGLLLLEEQDRDLWDRSQIQTGLEWLARSAEGDRFSRYHAEAGIAAEHCMAESYEKTRWDRIAESYARLEQTDASPIHRLNQAVAVAEWRGPKAGLDVLEGFEPPTWLEESFVWAAVLADLHRRNNNQELARQYGNSALKLAPTPALQEPLRRRLDAPLTNR